MKIMAVGDIVVIPASGPWYTETHEARVTVISSDGNHATAQPVSPFRGLAVFFATEFFTWDDNQQKWVMK